MQAPLSLKLNDVDTSMPLLVEGRQPLCIKDANFVEVSSGKGVMLVVNLTTVDPSRDTKGKVVNPGFPIRHNFMWPTPGTEFGDSEWAESYLQKLTLFMLAVLGLKDTPENKATLPEFDDTFVADLSGKLVMGNIGTSKVKDGSDYGPRSEVKSFSAIG